MTYFSQLLNRFNESATIKVSKLSRELKAAGKDIIDLSIGEPDFNTPNHIKEGAVKAIENNFSKYPPVAGYPELREAVVNKLKRDNNLNYKAENIVISTGAKQSIANLILALIDEKDEVVIPTPYWVSYSDLVKMAGGTPVLVRTKLEAQYKLTPNELEKAITPKTKLFMFSSPSNPSGTFYSQQELQALVQVLEKHPHVLIMSDEIYEYINYIGKHESIAQFESIKDRVIIINGVSKGYAMTGWRIGYMAANVEIAKACEKIQSQFTSGANSIAQRASITALNSDLTASKEMTAEFTKRKHFMVKTFLNIPNIKLYEPEGAFYVFPDVSAYFGKKTKEGQTIQDSDDLSMYILQNALVSCVAGSAFGEPNCIRFSFATSMSNLEKAAQRLLECFSTLQ